MRAIYLTFIALVISACTPIDYYSKTVIGHLSLLSSMQPIDQMLLDESVPQSLKDRLTYALDARQFASDTLLLPDNNSYKSYADLNRDAANYNIYATPEFDLNPITWCFPVFGCFNFKGYFSQAEALTESEALKKRGFDAIVNGSIAFSTGGLFDDPIVSTMLAWPDWHMAGTIFHELAHQKLTLSGDSNFSEAFATSVETLGLTQWLMATGDQPSLNTFNAVRSREIDFLALLNKGKDQLRTLYQSGQDPQTMRVEKQAIFDAMRAEHLILKQKWGGEYYQAWFDQDLNNAHLLVVSTYHDLLPGFLQLFQDSNQQWDEFYRRATALSKLPKTERDQAFAELIARWNP